MSVSEIKLLMQKDIRGELTEEEQPLTSFRERAFVSSVAQVLYSFEKYGGRCSGVISCTTSGTVANDDVEALIRMVEAGADINAMDYEGRTPLHYCGIKRLCFVSNIFVDTWG